jgi:DNA-binding transcriptional MerR regulator
VPLSRSRDYLSISELLDEVRSDFPEVSISKIRFLESEGLLEPERTGSGYRKFYPGDVERLRAILSLQRDQFLPLKVIKERLENGSGLNVSAHDLAHTAEGPTGGAKPGQGRRDIAGVQLTRDELLHTCGLSEAELQSLEDFKLIVARDETYDENALLAGKAAKGFFSQGMEARHLRMYRQFAEREVAIFEQLLAPLARRKDEDATATTREAARKLEDLSRTMKEATLRSALQGLT